MSISRFIKQYSKETSDVIVCVYTFDSPVGKIIAAADENFLYLVGFEDSKNIEKMFQVLSHNLHCKYSEEKNKLLEKFQNELAQYFERNLKTFTVPVKPIGSEFQKEVWGKLQELPYGSTQTYGGLAKTMGRSASYSRAVGAACGANAHLLIIPCHRIVASGSRGGFSSGVDRKEWLLNHEKS